MFANLKEDARRLRVIKSKAAPWYVIESLLFENGFQAVVLHRWAHWFKSRKIPVLGPFFARLNLFLTGVDIGPGAEIGPGLMISHGVGLVIGGHAKIGSGATLLHGVTLGSPSPSKITAMPVVGDDVFLGAGATLIGDLEVGDGAFIGAGALITESVSAGSKVLSKAEVIVLPAPAAPASLAT